MRAGGLSRHHKSGIVPQPEPRSAHRDPGFGLENHARRMVSVLKWCSRETSTEIFLLSGSQCKSSTQCLLSSPATGAARPRCPPLGSKLPRPHFRPNAAGDRSAVSRRILYYGGFISWLWDKTVSSARVARVLGDVSPKPPRQANSPISGANGPEVSECNLALFRADWAEL